MRMATAKAGAPHLDKMKSKKVPDSFWFYARATVTCLFLSMVGAGLAYHDWKKSHEIDAGELILVVAFIFGACVCILWVKLLGKTRTHIKILLKEKNVTSARTAYVNDDGSVLEFTLFPKDVASFLPKRKGKLEAKDFESLSGYWTWLYRHLKLPADEKETMNGSSCLQQDLKPMFFERQPTFKLLWADSGNSVALLLNDEPWAFIHEDTHQGYSKGMLKARFGNPWNQELFEKTFKIT